MRPTRTNRQNFVRASPFLLAGVVLLAALGAPWYMVSAVPSNYPTGQISESFSTGGVTLTCNAGTDCQSSMRTFSDASLPATGSLYAGLTLVEIAAALAAFAVGGLILVRKRETRPPLALGLTMALLILAALGPLLLLIEQPGAICSDSPNAETPFELRAAYLGPTGGPACSWTFSLGGGTWYGPGGLMGPQSTFFGHATEPAGNVSWAPDIGWYVAWAGPVILGVGGGLLFFAGRSRAAEG
jgi:hypothetical protein